VVCVYGFGRCSFLALLIFFKCCVVLVAYPFSFIRIPLYSILFSPQLVTREKILKKPSSMQKVISFFPYNLIRLPSIPLSIQIKDSEAQSNTFSSPPNLLAFAVIVDVSDECHISAVEYAQKVLLCVSTLLAQVLGHSLRTQLHLTSRSEEKLTWHHAYSKSHVGQISYHNYKSQNATFSSNL